MEATEQDICIFEKVFRTADKKTMRGYELAMTTVVCARDDSIIPCALLEQILGMEHKKSGHCTTPNRWK